MSRKWKKDVNGRWTQVVYEFTASYIPRDYLRSSATPAWAAGCAPYRRYLVRTPTGAMVEENVFEGSVEKILVPEFRSLTEQEILDTEFTTKNSTSTVRLEQAKCLKENGYNGPVSGGEARALKRAFQELGMPDCCRKGQVLRATTYMPKGWLVRRGPRQTTHLQGCYVFKSPLTDVPWTKFIALARMYSADEKGLVEAVKLLMVSPDVQRDIATLDTLDILSRIG